MARGNLSKVSLAELQGEMRRRARTITTLHRKRERLMRQLAVVESQIRELGAIVGVGRGGAISMRKRPKNATNLIEALAQVLKGRTMSVTEVAEAVQRAGYKTTSSTFRTIVNQTLINSGRFRRVSRGQYTAK